jgi:GGDEF domain-containing protein
VSAGGALVAADDPDERAALARADAAMYDAKHRGRDDFAVAGNGSGR